MFHPPHARSRRSAIFAVALTAAGCHHSQEITGPGGFSVLHGTLSVTLTSIESPRPLCPQLEQYVGSGWSSAVDLISTGQDVTLELTASDPDSLTVIYNGSRIGESIVAEATPGRFGGFSCPGDSAVTPEVASDLRAVLSGTEIQGDYEELYGPPSGRVVFHYHFQGELAPVP